MQNKTLYSRDTKQRWVCPACGYEEIGEQCFKTCPLCQAKQETACIPLPKELIL